MNSERLLDSAEHAALLSQLQPSRRALEFILGQKIDLAHLKLEKAKGEDVQRIQGEIEAYRKLLSLPTELEANASDHAGTRDDVDDVAASRHF